LKGPYTVFHPTNDGSYPVGKVGGHVLCFSPTLEKARCVASALNCYHTMGFDYDDDPRNGDAGGGEQ